MKVLDPGYSFSIRKADKNNWNDLLLLFDDATYYQSSAFGNIHWGEEKLNHAILKKNKSIVSIAQLAIFHIFPFGDIVAYLNWGPLWKLKYKNKNIKNFQNMIKALHHEYVRKRGCMLKILPKLVPDEDKEKVLKIFKQENFKYRQNSQQTVVIDLAPSLEDLRKNFPREVRRLLNRAEKENLELIEEFDDEAYKTIVKIIKEMRIRKKYFGSDQSEALIVNKNLPSSLQIRIIVAYYQNEPVAVLGWNTTGKIGFPLVSATGDKALKLNVALLLHWEMIKYYKIHGFRVCDLAGVNPKTNPGGYFFKKRLAGRYYKEIDHYIGQFEACKNWVSLALFHTIIYVKKNYQKLAFKIYSAIYK